MHRKRCNEKRIVNNTGRKTGESFLFRKYLKTNRIQTKNLPERGNRWRQMPEKEGFEHKKVETQQKSLQNTRWSPKHGISYAEGHNAPREGRNSTEGGRNFVWRLALWNGAASLGISFDHSEIAQIGEKVHWTCVFVSWNGFENYAFQKTLSTVSL